MQSITLTAASSGSGGTYNLKGMGGTIQLVVTANYSNGKSEIVTPKATSRRNRRYRDAVAGTTK